MGIDEQLERPGRSYFATLMALEMGQLEVAARNAEKSLSEDGPSDLAFVALSVHSSRTSRREEALDWAERALEVDPERPDLLGLAALMLADVGRLDEAWDVASRALALAPNDNDLLNNAAIVAGRRGDHPLALSLLDSASDPADPALLSTRAAMLWVLGESEQALAAARSALVIDANHLEATTIALGILLQRGERGPALVEALETILRLDPGHPAALSLTSQVGFAIAGLPVHRAPLHPMRVMARLHLIGLGLAGFGLGVGLAPVGAPLLGGVLGVLAAAPPTLLLREAMRWSMIRRVARVSEPIAAVLRDEPRGVALRRVCATLLLQWWWVGCVIGLALVIA